VTDPESDRLRKALEQTKGATDLASMLSRQSLAAHASRTDEGRAIVHQVLSVSSELDLHLEGVGVRDHETAAATFGKFVTRSAAAVKEIAKDISGKRSYSSRLQVLAPSVGSVRVILKTPEPFGTTGDELPRTETDQLDDLALRRLVALLLQADADEDAPDDQQTLDAALHGLRGETRNAVRLMSQSVLDAHWEIEGEFRPRGDRPTPVTITPQGAARLVTAAKVESSTVETETVEGRVDGWIWSEQVVAFEPEEGRRIRAVVPPDLQAKVAVLGREDRPLCRARFTVVTAFAPGQTASRRRSFALEAIEPLGDADTFQDLP
jgi:hypothetical protein